MLRGGGRRRGIMGNCLIQKITIFLLLLCSVVLSSSSNSENGIGNSKNNINRDDDLVWLVQLSDLHFSVHHPDRSRDFLDIVGPTLSFINPSLVLLTGDLTDGKSKDFFTMKQDEDEWIEYREVMRDVIKRSGLDESTFYDVRGNHDNFGVPVLNGSLDFYSKYSINGQLKRSRNVNSITIQTSKRKILFVGFDSTTSSGLRGPTNLFGHPTDELLSEINSELSQWDSQPAQPVTKISFGHFPLSFSAASKSGKTLQDIFVNNSLSAYLCGHLHTKFGKNLKRHHHGLYSKQLIQFNGHRTPSQVDSCSTRIAEFWEWEMGDWRKSRAMRVLAIDRGHISFIDVNFKLGAQKTIILPTFPLDSRFTSSLSSHNYKCDDPSSYGFIRALVFSSSQILSVVVTIYDSSSGNLITVLETQMTKVVGPGGGLYVAPWNIRAFEDSSPDRYLLQIKTTDILRRSTETELRPFSVIGIPAKLPWSWKEFIVMGCQWDSLYYPILWGYYYLVFSILLIPKIVLFFSKRQYKYKDFKVNKSFVNFISWIFSELYNVPVTCYCLVGYLFYLVLCPWFSGQVFTEGHERVYMTYKGWALRFKNVGKMEFFGFPDVMVVVLPHLWFVVLPGIVAIIGLAAESGVYRDFVLSLSSKKNDDFHVQSKEHAPRNVAFIPCKRWLRKFLLFVSLGIFWKHIKNCVALVKAYEMNPIIHFPVYSFAIPLLLAYTIWRTRESSYTASTSTK